MSYNCNISYTCLFKLFHLYWTCICYLKTTWCWFVCWLLIPGRARKLQIAFLRLLCQMAFIWKENTIWKGANYLQKQTNKIMDNLKALCWMKYVRLRGCILQDFIYDILESAEQWELRTDLWLLGSWIRGWSWISKEQHQGYFRWEGTML